MNSFGFLLIIVAFAFLWFVLVRPQKRRQVEQQQMLQRLRQGDEVLTVGGMYGVVSRLDEEQVTVEIAPGVEVRVARRAIAGVTPEDGPEEPEAEPAGDDDSPFSEPPAGEDGG